mmetsp:Transcript_45879/g.121263  ORF Transcript_45879/g.121263 Transcript_45879/m.121263 type:complete len:273 (+) Transcript_45879:1446-2264(+)
MRPRRPLAARAIEQSERTKDAKASSRASRQKHSSSSGQEAPADPRPACWQPAASCGTSARIKKRGPLQKTPRPHRPESTTKEMRSALLQPSAPSRQQQLRLRRCTLAAHWFPSQSVFCRAPPRGIAHARATHLLLIWTRSSASPVLPQLLSACRLPVPSPPLPAAVNPAKSFEQNAAHVLQDGLAGPQIAALPSIEYATPMRRSSKSANLLSFQPRKPHPPESAESGPLLQCLPAASGVAKLVCSNSPCHDGPCGKGERSLLGNDQARLRRP